MKLGNESHLRKDYQTIGETYNVDSFGDKIKIKESRRVSISYKLNKRGKKMIDSIKDRLVLDTLIACNSKVGLNIYRFIRDNPSRIGLLVKVGTVKPISIDYLSKRLKADRRVVSKCINALIKVDLLKKDKRSIYLDPMCYLPLVNDYELRCLMDRYNDGFIKPLETYREELLILFNQAKANAKARLDFGNKEIVNTEYINIEK